MNTQVDRRRYEWPHGGGREVERDNASMSQRAAQEGDVQLAAFGMVIEVAPAARDQVNDALREHGVPFDLHKLRPENLEELVDQLNDLTVDVDQEKTKVRIFCE